MILTFPSLPSSSSFFFLFFLFFLLSLLLSSFFVFFFFSLSLSLSLSLFSLQAQSSRYHKLTDVLLSPALIAPVMVLLVIVIYWQQVLIRGHKRRRREMNRELEKLRQDKRFLLNKQAIQRLEKHSRAPPRRPSKSDSPGDSTINPASPRAADPF